MSVTYKLPYDTPLRYLPLVYILPYDLLMRCPTLRKLPRRMGAFNDPEWQEVLGSQQFRNEIMDAMAALVFPHFGLGGWKEHYTGRSPASSGARAPLSPSASISPLGCSSSLSTSPASRGPSKRPFQKSGC